MSSVGVCVYSTCVAFILMCLVQWSPTTAGRLSLSVSLLVYVCLFRSLMTRLCLSSRSLAHPSLPSAPLSLTLAPQGLSLSFFLFLRPHPIIAPPDPAPPLPHQRFLSGRFVLNSLPFLQLHLFFCFCLIPFS